MTYWILATIFSTGFIIAAFVASKTRYKQISGGIAVSYLFALAITIGLAAALPNIESKPIVEPTMTQETTVDIADYYVTPLVTGTSSNTTEGAVKYGATMVLGDLDEYYRSTFAHIQLKNSHEPGNNGESRKEYVGVDPVGWRNFKLNGNWANNRCHLVGYQFSGLNDELRNLSIGTSYLNKGTENSGMDESNPDGMLFYEQQLDDWLEANPDKLLDLYVKPIYFENYTTPDAYYMQWVGITAKGDTVPIEIQGNSTPSLQNTYGVVLKNQSPSYVINFASGEITWK